MNSNVSSGKAPYLGSLGESSSHKSGGKEAERRSRPVDKGLGSINRDYSKTERGRRRPMKFGTEQNHVELSSSPNEATASDVQDSASEGEEQINGGMSHKGLSSKKSSRSNAFPRAQSPTRLERVDAEPACSSDGTADRGEAPLQSKVVPALLICLSFRTICLCVALRGCLSEYCMHTFCVNIQ